MCLFFKYIKNIYIYIYIYISAHFTFGLDWQFVGKDVFGWTKILPVSHKDSLDVNGRELCQLYHPDSAWHLCKELQGSSPTMFSKGTWEFHEGFTWKNSISKTGNLPQLQVKLIWSFQRCKGQCLANLPETSSHPPGKLMLAKQSFPFGMPSIPNYWFQEGKTTGWGWGKDDLLTKYERSGGQQPNATHICLRNAVTLLGLLGLFLWNLWPSNVADLVDLHNQFSTDWFCIHSATLWAAWNDHHCSTIKRCFCFSTRCISSEASEHISNFMGLLLVTEKSHCHQFNQSWSTSFIFAGIEARTPNVAAKHLMVAL